MWNVRKLRPRRLLICYITCYTPQISTIGMSIAWVRNQNLPSSLEQGQTKCCKHGAKGAGSLLWLARWKGKWVEPEKSGRGMRSGVSGFTRAARDRDGRRRRCCSRAPRQLRRPLKKPCSAPLAISTQREGTFLSTPGLSRGKEQLQEESTITTAGRSPSSRRSGRRSQQVSGIYTLDDGAAGAPGNLAYADGLTSSFTVPVGVRLKQIPTNKNPIGPMRLGGWGWLG